MKKAVLTLLFLLTVTTIYAAKNAQIIGTVNSVSGKVTIIRNKKKIKAVKQMALHNNDRLITGRSARLIFKMNNNCKIVIAKNSSVKISSIMSKDGNSNRLALIYGTVKAKVNNSFTTNDKIKIRGISATVGVRGTTFSVSASEAPGLLVQVTEGKIILKSKGNTVTVPAGYRATASGRGLLSLEKGIISEIKWLVAQRLKLKDQFLFILLDLRSTIKTMIANLSFDTFLVKISVFLKDYATDLIDPLKLSRRKRRRELRKLLNIKTVLKRALKQITTLEIIRYKLEALLNFLGDSHASIKKLFDFTMNRFKIVKKAIKKIYKAEGIYRKRMYLYQLLSRK